MTGELTLFILRLAFLAVLWIFVFSIIYALRSDLFGTRASEYQRSLEQSRQQTFGAAVNGTPAAAAVAPVSASAAAPPMPAPTPLSNRGARAEPVGAGHATGLSSADIPTQAVAQQRPESSAQTAVVRPSRLLLTSGPRRGQELHLDARPLSIGRHPDSDLVIADDYSSTHHARLVPSGASWMLQDLDSTNGTFVEGRRISSSVPLSAGQSVRIGTTTFELRA